MKKFNLFNEWRRITIYGDNLKDAILRKKEFQRPDKYSNGVKSEEGEWIVVKKIHGYVDTAINRRQVLFECVDGRIFVIDAAEENVHLT